METGSETARELGSKYKDSTISFLKCDVLVENEVKGLSVKMKILKIDCLFQNIYSKYINKLCLN